MFDIDPEAIEKAVASTGLTEGVFTEDDIIDADVLNFYTQRFRLFVADNVREAVFAYVHQACGRDDLNEITKVAILQASLNI